MKKIIYSFFLSFIFCLTVLAQHAALNIIPQPKSVKTLNQTFEFNHKTKIVTMDDQARPLAAFLNDYLLQNYGFKLEYVHKPKKTPVNSIVFERLNAAGRIPTNEAYGLYIVPQGARIAARGNEGLFYGLQSFLQLLPVKIEKGKAKLPAADITDEPRFRYRGMHLDVGRHFFPVAFIKKYLDLMAQYKFNYFHWHLTEDQGWRIEIKKYPRLTEIGSRRPETMKEKNFQPYVGDRVPVEGFYTQEQIKEVVAHAKSRFITVIPEIELPGHSSAALAAYPEFGCKTNYQYKVQTTWGIFKEVYCPTEATFKFLEDVLEETIALFPDSPYIHIGGDEVLKDHWKESPVVQELKQRENLKEEHEVQSYFIRRIEKFINSRGKKIIGWDEILEGGLAPNAVVMSWRGEKGGIAAAKMKHDVIMTPTDYLYFDYGQGDPRYEPINIGSYITLERVYSYNPHPKELTDEEKQYILGAQANVWTEYMKTPDKVEYMVFPRLLALAEVVWTPLDKKNYADFLRRLQQHFPRLDKQNVNYRIPEPGNLQNGFLLDDCQNCSFKVSLEPITPGSKIFYTLDKSEPTENSKLYTGPIEFPIKAGERIDLKTIVVLPTGRKSVTYAATFLGRKALPAVELKDKKQGVNYAFYKESFNSASEMEKAAPLQTGETKSIMFGQFREKLADKRPFAVAFDGYIYAPKDEIYEFELETKDGAVLLIDGEKVIDADDVKGREVRSGVVALKQGYHKFGLKHFNRGGDWTFGVRWGIKGRGLNQIYGGELFH